jgi:hypothetical protein
MVNGRRWRKIYWPIWTQYYRTVIRKENTSHKIVRVGRIWYPQETNIDYLTHGLNCVVLGLNSGPTFHAILWIWVKLQIYLVGIQNKELGQDLDTLNV